MNTTQRWTWLTGIALLFALSTSAEEVAFVKDARVNVRGQPSLVGEVITQLQQGEKVIVLEEVPALKPKTNEPPKWAKIQMPANTPVWVFVPFLDLTNKVVKAPRLNLRAGPGENYSVVGLLQRGVPIKEIRRVEEWMEIETPPGAYAFVAADLLTKTAPAAAPALAQQEVVKPTPPAPIEQPQPKPFPPPAPLPTPKAETTAAVEKPAATHSAQLAPMIVVTPPPTQPAAPPHKAETSAQTTAPTSTLVKPSGEALQRRIVRREGLVRSTVSIQAPTYYELLNPDNRKTINYLHTDALAVNLKDYRGRRIIVTGEEAIDPRWPKTPVIEVEHLELIP